MNEHCRGCCYHHNAHHKKDSRLARNYNDWCCKTGRTARKAIGECKLKELKKQALPLECFGRMDYGDDL